jgi:RNA polymerase sigma-70 factor (ECF subfamily)
MLVVLDRLRPPERVAFVLHDMFALPFAEIAEVLDCSPEAARQLASRARRAVRARRGEVAEIGRERRRELVQAFFAASRGGDMAKLMSILDANVALKIDPLLAPGGAPLLVRGADVVARRASLGAAQQNAATLMLVDGEPGIVVAPNGKLRLVMTFETVGRKIAAIDIVADPCRLEKLTLAMVDD